MPKKKILDIIADAQKIVQLGREARKSRRELKATLIKMGTPKTETESYLESGLHSLKTAQRKGLLDPTFSEADMLESIARSAKKESTMESFAISRKGAKRYVQFRKRLMKDRPKWREKRKSYLLKLVEDHGHKPMIQTKAWPRDIETGTRYQEFIMKHLKKGQKH